MDFNPKGFPAYFEESDAKNVLRYFHSIGMEGNITDLHAGNRIMYGVQILWPEDWTDNDVQDIMEKCHEAIEELDG